MSDDMKMLFPEFFQSYNFTCKKKYIQEEIVVLIKDFMNQGFDVWPEWRPRDAQSDNRVWVLKTENGTNKSRANNVATVRQSLTGLKVEVYYGQNDKPWFNFSSSEDNTELFEMVKDNYTHKLGKYIFGREQE